MHTVIKVLFFSMIFTGSANAATQAVLHKNPQCGCCDEYAKVLEQHGYQVKLENTTDLQSVRTAAGVPEQLAGCHTMMIGDYVVEGLVPVSILNRLLKEKPQIRGISLPGMPVGAPGMPGPKEGPFKIYEIKDGEPKVYAIE
jgi:hypothetical protein